MCRIEVLRDIHPQEIRTRKTIRTCLFSPGQGRACRRTRVYDHSKMYHIRRFCLERRRRAPSPSPPRSQMIQPVESRRSRERSTPNIESRRPSSPPRRQSDPIRIQPPFPRRTSSDSDNNRETQMHRRREGVSRPFIVDPPESHRSERQSTRRRSQTSSPQRRFPVSDHRRQEGPRDSAPSTPSPRESQTNREPRRPRERSPVAERVPVRRRHSSPRPPRVVEIHNYRPEDKKPSRTSSRERNGEKRVHFASDVESEPTRERDAPVEKDDHRGRQDAPGPHRSDSSSENRNRSYEIIEERPTRPQSPHERHARKPSPWPGRQRETQRDRAAPNIIHVRPRIIQDGNRHLSRVGERICTEARGRPSYETYRDEFERPSRGFGRVRTFDIGNERIVIYDRDRPRWR